MDKKSTDLLIQKADRNHDNKIDFNEFLILFANYRAEKTTRNTLSDSDLKHLFDEFDANKSGYLEILELKNLFIQSGENPSNDRLNKLIKTYDSNGNGKIEFKEFLKMYNHYRTNPDIENTSSIKSQPSTNNIQNDNNNNIKYSHAFLEVCASQLHKYPDLSQVTIFFFVYEVKVAFFNVYNNNYNYP